MSSRIDNTRKIRLTVTNPVCCSGSSHWITIVLALRGLADKFLGVEPAFPLVPSTPSSEKFDFT